MKRWLAQICIHFKEYVYFVDSVTSRDVKANLWPPYFSAEDIQLVKFAANPARWIFFRRFSGDKNNLAAAISYRAE